MTLYKRAKRGGQKGLLKGAQLAKGAGDWQGKSFRFAFGARLSGRGMWNSSGK